MEKEHMPELPEEILTVERGKQLYFLSFKFSQGDMELQEKLFSYLHTIHPSWRMSDDLYEEIQDAARKPMMQLVINKPRTGNLMVHTGETKVTFEGQFIAELRVMQSAFASNNRPVDNLIPTITESILNQDYKYLTGKGEKPPGRPNRPVPEPGRIPTAQTDKFLSHMCYYGLQHHKTGAREYDQLFSEMAQNLEGRGEQRNTILTRPLQKQMREVVSLYNRHHPHNPAMYNPVSLERPLVLSEY